MPVWSIATLNESDIEEFAQCQFAAFVGNNIHDIVYPTPQYSAAAQRKVLAERDRLGRGNQVVYLKAVDDKTGQLVGGIKVYYYGSEDANTKPPYPPGKPVDEEELSDEEQYQRFVLGEFLGRRRRMIGYPHACEPSRPFSTGGRKS